MSKTFYNPLLMYVLVNGLAGELERQEVVSVQSEESKKAMLLKAQQKRDKRKAKNLRKTGGV